MKRKLRLLVPALFFAAAQVFAQNAGPGGAVSSRILDNDYYIQSLRLTGLARHSYDNGDYDASTAYAEEAVRYARLSDEYVADHALEAAQSRLVWADGVHADSRYPQAYRAARAAWTDAETSYSHARFGDAVDAANRVFEALSVVSAVAAGSPLLPSRYVVRTWASARDCLWNIAGRPWVYGDSRKWRLLYDANRSRLPQPDNPDLIEPGMVLEIPSIRGEAREGLWSPQNTYPALR